MSGCAINVLCSTLNPHPAAPSSLLLGHPPFFLISSYLSKSLSDQKGMASFYLSNVNGELVFKYEKRTPLSTPKKRVLVIGGSVTGLTTAWALLDAGYAVTVVSDQWAPATPRITGQIAGAL